MSSSLSLLSMTPLSVRTNLLGPEHSINKALNKVIDQEYEISLNKNIEIPVKIMVTIVAAGARIFYIPISLRLPLGPIFAAGNCVSFFVLEYWAATKSIKKFVLDQEDEIQFLSESRVSKTQSITTFFAAEIIALISQVPNVFAAYNYNKKEYRILAGVVTGVSGSLFTLHSVQLSLSQKLKRETLDQTQQKLLEIKKELIELTNVNNSNFLNKSHQEKLKFLSEINSIRDLDEADFRSENYLKNIFTIQKRQPMVHSICRKIGENCITVGGIGLNLTLQTAVAMYVFTQTKNDIYDNDYLAVFFSSLVVLSNVHLMGSSIASTSKRAYHAAIDTLFRKSTPSISEQYRPKLTFALKILFLTMNGFGLGPNIVIWGEFFDNQTLQRYFQSTICISMFLILFTASLDMVDEVVEYLIEKTGTSEERKILRMSKEFKQLEYLLSKFSLGNIGRFIENLPNDFKRDLLERFHITKENIDILFQS